MAQKEDLEERLRLLNPAMVEFSEEIFRGMAEQGLTDFIMMVEGMTPEEEEMAIFEGLLKRGYSPEAAEVEAKEMHAAFVKAFGP
ncbi:MAG: hypothetical protein ACLQF0_05515 [Dissulfurispiraceae bacterium]